MDPKVRIRFTVQGGKGDEEWVRFKVDGDV